MSWIKRSITRQIGLYVMSTIFIIFIIYYFFLNVQLRNYFELESKDSLFTNSKYISLEIESFLQKYINIVELAKNNPDFIKIAEETTALKPKAESSLYDRVTNQLKDIAKIDKHITMSYIAVSKANDLITNLRDDYKLGANYELDSREWYTSIIKNSRTTITKPYIDLVTKKIIITVAAPILNNNDLLGIFALDITIEDLQQALLNYKIGDSGYVALVYKDGLIMSYPDLDTTKNVYLQDIINNSDKLLSGNNGVTTWKYNGEEKFFAYLPIKNTDLIVFTIIPKTEVYSKLTSFLIINMLILIGVLSLSLYIMNIIKNLISTPVIKISRDLENYGSNRNKVYLPDKYLKRRDEIGGLYRGLSIMQYEISDYVIEIENKNKELTKAKDEIEIEHSLFKTTIHSLGDGVISTDGQGKVNIMNNAAERLTGWTVTGAEGLDITEVLNVKSKEEFAYFLERVFKLGQVITSDDIQLIQKNGEEILIECSVAPIKDGCSITGSVVVFRDFTEKKQRQEQIIYLSYHDQLTGLHNRRFYAEELERIDIEQKLPLSVAMVDVNGLKLTNDAFGHLAGDKLLIRVAKILLSECRKTDVVARIGGDEFIILLPNTTKNGTSKIISRIYKAIDEERMDNVIISISIGYETKTNIKESVENTVSKAEEQMYMKKLTESKSMRNKTIQAILSTLRETNEREKVHSERVSKISREIAAIMDFDEKTIKEVEYAGLIHDIGKITVNSNILNKSTKLTDSEYLEIKRHTDSGYQILRSVDSYTSLAEIALSHHERWDGSGYPRGLKGEEIPLIARIISVADSYEAMTSIRPYKDPLSKEKAIKELIKNSGSQFDPEIVKVLVEKILINYSEDI